MLGLKLIHVDKGTPYSTYIQGYFLGMLGQWHYFSVQVKEVKLMGKIDTSKHEASVWLLECTL